MKVDSSLNSLILQNGTQPVQRDRARIPPPKPTDSATEKPATVQPVPLKASSQAVSHALSTVERFATAEQDTHQLPHNARTAISAYQAIDVQERRQEVQQILGVDTYV